MKRSVPTKPAVIVLLLFSITLASAQSMKDQSGPKEWVPGQGWVPAGSGTSDSGNYNGPGLAEAFRKRSEWKRQQKQQESWEANEQGVKFANQGDWANAVKSYELSLKKDPGDPVVTRNLARAKAALANERGIAASKNGDTAAAVAFFQEAQKKDPENTYIRNNLTGARQAAQHHCDPQAMVRERGTETRRIAPCLST